MVQKGADFALTPRYRVTTEARTGYNGSRTMREVARELIETAILALLIFLALQFSIQNFRVEGSSMEPTLQEGQYIIVNRLAYLNFAYEHVEELLPFLDLRNDDGGVFPLQPPERGDVAIFRYPEDPSLDFVKRVIALPGDTVSIDHGQVYVNGVPLDEPYVPQVDHRDMEERLIPSGSYFVLGDNRRRSDDSRDWGNVPAANFVGKAWVIYWPFASFATIGAES